MRLSNQGQTLDNKVGRGGGSVKLYLKKIFDFDSEIAIQAIENSEEGKDKKTKEFRGWNVWFFSGLRAGQGVCCNVWAENGQMQTNGFCSFIITYYLILLL